MTTGLSDSEGAGINPEISSAAVAPDPALSNDAKAAEGPGDTAATAVLELERKIPLQGESPGTAGFQPATTQNPAEIPPFWDPGVDQTPGTAPTPSATLPMQIGKPRWRAYLSALTVLGACALWITSLSKLGVSSEALPWYITVTVIAIVSARDIARPQSPVSDFEVRKRGSQEAMTLLEAWALAYVATSLLLYGWVSAQTLLPPEPPRKLVQFVDIKLVSDADFANRESPMPGTQEAEEQHKRDSDATTMQGSLSATKVAQIAKQTNAETPAEEHQSAKAVSKEKARKQSPIQGAVPEHLALAHTSANHPRPSPHTNQPTAPFTAAKPQKDQTSPTDVKPSAAEIEQKSAAKAAKKEPLFEEVQPPELVEMIENDGSRMSENVFQLGGRSDGGTGKANELSAYIKELHKRIKNSWTPPRGLSRRATVLFRIRKNGSLAFVKIVTSSGDDATDIAAYNSVTAAAERKPLPAAYEFPYLDVQYTFNYAADELKEVKPLIKPLTH